ncbi:MAG: repeat-containing protein, partial [Armatimonadetes bacterium]|nr:repeat-containing protein [Armatimonadota bacterium]
MSQRRLFPACLWLFLVLITAVHANAVGYRRSAPAPRRPAGVLGPGDSVQMLSIKNSGMSVDQTTGMVYLSLGSSVPNGNSILPLNPATMQVGTPVFIGSEPELSSISDDGQFLYVFLGGASQVRRMHLPTMTPEIQFPVMPGQHLGVEDIDVVPTQPHAVMVTMRHYGLSPRSAGTAVYDDGVRRQNMAFWNNVHAMHPSGEKVYLFHNETTGAGVTTYALTAEGLTAISPQSHALHDFWIGGVYHGGMIYSNGGYLWDPDADVLMGRYGAGGNIPVVDGQLNRVYHLYGEGSSSEIRAYDKNTFLLLGTLPLPATQGFPIEFTGLPDGGFVYRTTTQVFVVHTGLRPGPPQAPSGLTATLQTGGVQLNWSDNSTGEDGFRVERSANGGAFGVIATLGANSTSYLSTGLAADTTYAFRVRAYNGAGSSAFSNTVTVAPLPPPPAAPGNLTAAVLSPSRIDLAWEDNSGNETGFEIERKTGSGSFSVVGAVGAGLAAFSDTSVVEQTTYTYRVRAVNLGGSSAYSNEAGGTTPPAPTAAPTSLTATAFSSSEVRLSWQDNSANETGFRIERRTTGAFAELAAPGPHAGTGTVTYADLSGIASDTTYIYRVRATGALGDSATSNEVGVTIPSLPPTAPSALTAVPASATRINLAWQDNSNNESEFRLERKIGAAAFTPLVELGSNIITYADTPVEPQTTYVYRIKAWNGGGSSAYSDTATATTPAPPTAAPSNLVAAAVTSLEIRVAWKDNSPNETGFRLERRGPTGDFSQLTVRAASTGIGKQVLYTDTAGLLANSTYTYRVRAYGPNGESDYSNEATATTAPGPPTAPDGLTATLTNSTTVRLTWTDNSSNETGFRVERRTGGSGAFLFIGGTTPELTLLIDPGLEPDTLYSYRVQATGTASNSGYSNVVDLPTLPKVPTSLTAVAGAPGQIVLHWNEASVTESGFKIERKNGNAFSQIGTAGAGASGFTDTDRAPNSEYVYRVRAVNAGGESAPSTEATGLTLPAAPSGLVITPASAEVLVLRWTDNNPSPPAVRVERSANGGQSYVLAGETLGGGVTYQDTGLNAGTTYTYRLQATNTSGSSGYSGTATGTTFPAVPASPRNFTATALTAHAIRLNWEDNSANESGFEILRRLPGGTTFDLFATTPANATTYLDSGLTG